MEDNKQYIKHAYELDVHERLHALATVVIKKVIPNIVILILNFNSN